MSLAWSSVKALSIPVGGVSRDVKRVAVGGVEVWRKLPYDAEVQYIESTGRQYIDTTTLEQNDNLTATFSIRTAASYALTRGGWANGTVCFRGNNGADVLFRNNGLQVVKRVSQDTPFNVGISPTAMFVEDVSVATSIQPNATPVRLFCNYSGIRVYSFSIAGKVNLIPVRVGSGSSAVGYLYDRANPTGGPLGNGLYPNAGSGAFVVGPDANA